MADDKRLARIEDKIDGLGTHLGSIDVTLAGQHVQLTEHIRRTAALEKQLEPIQDHVSMIKGAMKLVALLGIIAGIVASIMAFSK